MDYQAIDACPNDHILYHGEHALKEECQKIQINRYKMDQVTKNVPHKVEIML